ncbi:hypothetical protein M0R45_033964 [Rubus argutus]|uniref:Uncharacterized protein n=1 Tax=Rubus argutus TaxID=59490 RepID=A0AAW1VSF2_RUBAR
MIAAAGRRPGNTIVAEFLLGNDGLLLCNRSGKDRSRGSSLGSSWLSFIMGCFTVDRESFLAAGLDERPVGKDGEVLIGDWRKQSYGNWAAALNDGSTRDDELMQDWDLQRTRGDAEGLHEPMKELRDKRKS